MFERQGKIICHDIRIQGKSEDHPTKTKTCAITVTASGQCREIDSIKNKRKLETFSDVMFVQSVLTTVKKDRIVKIALQFKSLNKATLKNKYQMINLESLKEWISEISKRKTDGKKHSHLLTCCFSMKKLNYPGNNVTL